MFAASELVTPQDFRRGRLWQAGGGASVAGSDHDIPSNSPVKSRQFLDNRDDDDVRELIAAEHRRLAHADESSLVPWRISSVVDGAGLPNSLCVELIRDLPSASRRWQCYAAVVPVIREPLLTPRLHAAKAVERVQITRIQLPPGESTGVHLHPVPVVGYILTGRIQFQVEGEAPQTLDAGDAFYESAGQRILHFDNLSQTEPATFVAFYLLGSNEHELIRMLEPL